MLYHLSYLGSYELPFLNVLDEQVNMYSAGTIF